MATSHSAEVHETVREYYGEILETNADLRTTACCSTGALPRHVKAIIAEVHPDILERFYGCGAPIPPALEGATVLDLGCGTGRDAYVLSKLVGPSGRVIGIDMTADQLAVAERHRDFHAERFGHDTSNVTFVPGQIEDLRAAGIEDGEIDVVVSNCVLNLSPDKQRAFAEALRVLRPGGEMYFSDVFADRRIATDLTRDPLLVGECLGGALYWEDFRRLMGALGCADVRVVASEAIAITDPEIDARIGHVGFFSKTVRAFKLKLEDRCEDYGQVARYLGTIPEARHAFVLDDHHVLQTGRPMLVCANTADMLSQTRYGRHMEINGDKATHFGLFDCAPTSSTNPEVGTADAGCC